MSYINSALKKAQREKDGSRQASYGNFHALPADNRPRGQKWKALAFSLTAAVFLAFVLFVGIDRYRAGTGRSIASKVSQAAPLQPMADTQAPAGIWEGAGRFSDAAELYGAAIKAQRDGRWGDAEIFYKHVLSIQPKHIRALNNLGVIHMREKRYAQAVELFVKAIAAKDDYVDPYYNLACLYSQQKNVQTSLGYLEQAVSIDGAARKWAIADADFSNLHALPEFKKITEKLVK
jgi:tetratricopeptide (TPR) repeat protein